MYKDKWEVFQRVMSQSEARFPSPEMEGHQKVTSFRLVPLKGVKMAIINNCHRRCRIPGSSKAL